MSVSNTTTNATVIYTLFLLPETGNPIAETSNSFFNNLQSGDYPRFFTPNGDDVNEVW